MPKTQSTPPKSTEQTGSGVGALLRLVWMAGGTLALIVTAMSIASRPTWSIGGLDVLFWSLVACTATVRYLDVTKFEGETASGQRATMKDFQSYLAMLAIFAGVLWCGAQSLHVGG